MRTGGGYIVYNSFWAYSRTLYAYLIKSKAIAFELILADFGQSITAFLEISCTGLLYYFHRFGSLVRFRLALISAIPKSAEKIAKNGTRKRLSLISKFSFVHLAQCNL